MTLENPEYSWHHHKLRPLAAGERRLWRSYRRRHFPQYSVGGPHRLVSWSYLLFTSGGGCGIVLQYDATSPFKQLSFEPSSPLSIWVGSQRTSV